MTIEVIGQYCTIQYNSSFIQNDLRQLSLHMKDTTTIITIGNIYSLQHYNNNISIMFVYYTTTSCLSWTRLIF